MAARQASAEGLARYQDDRFGMFVHWGLYSLIGVSEWVMFHRRMSVSSYEALAKDFAPTRFDADEFVRTAADAGQRYLTITSRHHDGFSMYDTALSDYKVTRTPFGRDPIAELAEACERYNVRLGFYVSLVDWHDPAYRETLRLKSGLAWSDYVGFLHGQVQELCTNSTDRSPSSGGSTATGRSRGRGYAFKTGARRVAISSSSNFSTLFTRFSRMLGS